MKLSWRYLLGGSVILSLAGLFSVAWVSSASEAFEVIPETDVPYFHDVETLGKPETNFRDKYNKTADLYAQDKDAGIGAQLASGIMNRDGIFLLLAHAVRVLSNVALVIGAAMIVYAGYLYVISVYAGDNASKANSAIKRAVIGIVVVIFSYALIRILVKFFL